jgi:mannitol-1-phosphate 5-dehydrogenase
MQPIKGPATAVIYGAGALGRGFIAPLLHSCGVAVSFVDADASLIDALRSNPSYATAVAHPNGYQFNRVTVANAWHLTEHLPTEAYNADLAFVCVGVSNYLTLAPHLRSARTVISCENAFESAALLRRAIDKPDVYLGIADVIASNTAPLALRNNDRLAVVSERGELVVGGTAAWLPEGIRRVDEIEIAVHWLCKMYLHNTPHAIAAYLGALQGYVYLHEAMQDAAIAAVVEGAMKETHAAVTLSGAVDRTVADAYCNKELARFRNALLYDPIERVAREPSRKLRNGERLLGAAALAFQVGVAPANILRGIEAAVEYCMKVGTDRRVLQAWADGIESESVRDHLHSRRCLDV